jgi:hypothetical protein
MEIHEIKGVCVGIQPSNILDRFQHVLALQEKQNFSSAKIISVDNVNEN